MRVSFGVYKNLIDNVRRCQRILSELMKLTLGYLFDLINVITIKELKVRYKSSFFGYLWSVANPLFFAMIYYFVFKLVMRVQVPNYTIFLIAGLFPWQWFANSVNSAAYSFIANAQMIKKTAFPRSVIPLSNVLMEGLHFLCTIPVIIVFLLVYNLSPTLNWLWGIPLIACGQIIFTFGIALLCASLNLFFRDLERFVVLTTMLLFYCTPILYDINMIPQHYQWIVEYNPLATMILSWRDLLLNGHLDLMLTTSLYLNGLFSFLIGVYVFNKLKYRFAEIL